MLVVALLLLLGLLLRPLERHTRAALRQQDVLAALHDRVPFDDELIVLVGGHALVHSIPLPQRNHDSPRQRWPRRHGW